MEQQQTPNDENPPIYKIEVLFQGDDDHIVETAQAWAWDEAFTTLMIDTVDAERLYIPSRNIKLITITEVAR